MSIEKFIEKVCVQPAVYWGNPRMGPHGQLVFDPPVQIKVRWEEKLNIVTDSEGREKVSKAKVLVTQDLEVEGRLYLGSLKELEVREEKSPVNLNPCDIPAAHEILRFDKLPMIRSKKEFVRSAYL